MGHFPSRNRTTAQLSGISHTQLIPLQNVLHFGESVCISNAEGGTGIKVYKVFGSISPAAVLDRLGKGWSYVAGKIKKGP